MNSDETIFLVFHDIPNNIPFVVLRLWQISWKQERMQLFKLKMSKWLEANWLMKKLHQLHLLMDLQLMEVMMELQLMEYMETEANWLMTKLLVL